MAENIVVKAKIKDIVNNCNIASDFADALNEVLLKEVKAAENRAKGNGRKTIQSKDAYVGKLQNEPMIVVRSKVKGASSEDVNTSSDFAEAINTIAIEKVKQAEARASANSRKTMMAKDL
jgi:histone H3/H4